MRPNTMLNRIVIWTILVSGVAAASVAYPGEDLSLWQRAEMSRIDKFRAEILAPFPEDYGKAELRRNDEPRLNLVFWSIPVREIFHKSPSGRDIQTRKLHALDLMLDLHDPEFTNEEGFDLLTRVASPNGGHEGPVRERATQVLVESIPLLTTDRQREVLPLLRKYTTILVERNRLPNGELGVIGKALQATMDHFRARAEQLIQASKEQDKILAANCMYLNSVEATKGLGSFAVQLVCGPAEIVANNPLLAPTRLAAGLWGSLKGAVGDLDDNIGGILTFGAVGNHGRALGESVGNTIPWILGAVTTFRGVRGSIRAELAYKDRIRALKEEEWAESMRRHEKFIAEMALKRTQSAGAEILDRFVEGELRTRLVNGARWDFVESAEAPLRKGFHRYPYRDTFVDLPEITLIRIVRSADEAVGGKVVEWFATGEYFGFVADVFQEGGVRLSDFMARYMASDAVLRWSDTPAIDLKAYFETPIDVFVTTDSNLLAQGWKPALDQVQPLESGMAGSGVTDGLNVSRFAYERPEVAAEPKGIHRYNLEYRVKDAGAAIPSLELADVRTLEAPASIDAFLSDLFRPKDQ